MYKINSVSLSLQSFLATVHGMTQLPFLAKIPFQAMLESTRNQINENERGKTCYLIKFYAIIQFAACVTLEIRARSKRGRERGSLD